jgi:hypothetical protein
LLCFNRMAFAGVVKRSIAIEILEIDIGSMADEQV